MAAGNQDGDEHGGPKSPDSTQTERPLWLDQLPSVADAPGTENARAALRSAPHGAIHAELTVSVPEHRFRPDRLDATRMARRPQVRFAVLGENLGEDAVEVIDLSATGLGLVLRDAPPLPKGTHLTELKVAHRGETIWSGLGLVVRGASAPGEPLGVRLMGPGLDLSELRFRDEVVETALGRALADEQTFERRLPADWRADVAALANAWSVVGAVLDAHQAHDSEGRWRDDAASLRLCSFVHSRTWPTTKLLMERLEARTQAFDAEQVQLGLAYAQRALASRLSVCEFMDRAYSKPQGYAGDYRMMELGQSHTLSGDTLFGRYLQYWVQRTSLGRAIRSRGDVALEAAEGFLAQQRPVRILSLACGPAVELRRLLSSAQRFDQPVEIVLLDQDESALRSCVDELNRVLSGRDDVANVSIHALHFSLRQLLRPKAGAEREVVQGVLQGMDLIYTMGLFDYLEQSTARNTVRSLFKLLNPGGQLLVGNLCRAADSSWIMEYGLAWPLIYRTVDEMVDMGRKVDQRQGHVDVREDASGFCLFLDARKHVEV